MQYQGTVWPPEASEQLEGMVTCQDIRICSGEVRHGQKKAADYRQRPKHLGDSGSLKYIYTYFFYFSLPSVSSVFLSHSFATCLLCKTHTHYIDARFFYGKSPSWRKSTFSSFISTSTACSQKHLKLCLHCTLENVKRERESPRHFEILAEEVKGVENLPTLAQEH